MIVTAPASSGGQAPPAFSNDAALLYGPEYPTQRWLPLRLGFHNPTDRAISGHAVMPIPGVAEYRTPVVVPARSRVEIVAHVAFPAPPERPEGSPEAWVGDAITVVTWEGDDLSQLARTDVRGKALFDESAEVEGVRPGGILLASGSSDPRRAYNVRPFFNTVQSLDDVPLVLATVGEPALPIDRIGYDAVRYVVWDMADAAAVDVARQSALLDFVRSGGVLIVPGPATAAADPTDTFLGPYLPVRVIGRRQANEILPSGETAPIRMRDPVDLCEAVETEGAEAGTAPRVVVRDAHYVHAAYKPLGHGRVVFTSFPVNGPADGDPRVAELWRTLLAADEPRGDWSTTAFDARKGELLQSMIGRSTAPFGVAAAVALGFLGLTLAAQFGLRGVRRPGAFLATAVLAVGLSAVLLTLGAAQRSKQELVGARLAVVDVSPEGGGLQRELLSYLGRERDDFPLSAAAPGATIRPVVAKPSAPPRIITDPFRVPQAGVHELTIQRVWQAEAALPRDRRAAAVATFGPAGLRLSIDNQLGGVIARPLLLWGSRALRLDDIAPGASPSVATLGVNPLGDFRNATLVSDVDRVRGGVLGALMTASHGMAFVSKSGMAPQLAGWLNPPALAPLVTAGEGAGGGPGPAMAGQVLVRLPVRVAASPPGAAVRIDSEFMSMRPAAFGVVPYNATRDQWTPTTNDTRMLLTFEPPPDVGAIRPTRATVELDVAAPGHVVRLRRGQAKGGTLTHDPAGPLLAEWDRPLGRQVVEFDCEAGDADAEGRVWLLVAVDGQPRDAAEGLPPTWNVNALRMSYVAEVVGPPRPPSLNRRAPVPGGEPLDFGTMPPNRARSGNGPSRGGGGGGGMEDALRNLGNRENRGDGADGRPANRRRGAGPPQQQRQQRQQAEEEQPQQQQPQPQQ